MPTWTIEYSLLLQGDYARFYEDLSLLRDNTEVISCNYSERSDRPAMMVTVSFMGAGPSNPRIQQIINRGTLQVPVDMWFPLQVSRLIPDYDGRYSVDRTEPRGRLQYGAIFDDAAHFERRSPEVQARLHNGMLVSVDPNTGLLVPVDPATGLLVPSAENPIGMVTGVDLARPGTDITGVSTFDNLWDADPRAASEFRREFEGQFTQEVRDLPPDSAYEHIGMAVFNPRALRQLRMYSGDNPPPEEDKYTEYFGSQSVPEGSRRGGVPSPLDVPLTPRRVALPTFELQNNPQINLADIRNRRFDVLEGSRGATVNQIQGEVDRQIFEALEASQGVTSMGTPFTNRPIQGFKPKPPEPEDFLRRTRFEKILEEEDYLL
jgi:hypothetical protein